jgi:hypothetical protein
MQTDQAGDPDQHAERPGEETDHGQRHRPVALQPGAAGGQHPLSVGPRELQDGDDRDQRQNERGVEDQDQEHLVPDAVARAHGRGDGGEVGEGGRQLNGGDGGAEEGARAPLGTGYRQLALGQQLAK